MVSSLLAGRYRRTRMLGRGSMGEVWLAEDELLHRTVAIKTVLSSEHAEALDRIVREARLAARLNHPNAVAVHDLVVADGQPHVVMEYVPGRSLADELRAHGGLPPERVRAVGLAVAAALARAHELGIVHRDVKPANVLLPERDAPKLADFGIARSTGTAAGTASGLLVGTPAYLAPEIVHGARADARSDIWSLGATLYAAVAGRSPFHRTDEDNVYAVLHRVVNEPVAVPGGDPVIADAIMRMLRADPAQRPTAAEVGDLLAGSAVATAPVPRPARARRRPGRGVLAAVAAVVVAGSAVAVVAGSGDDSDDGRARTSAPAVDAGSASRSGPAGGVAYRAPGGITVTAPAGWIPDDSAGIANVRDYRAPGSTDRRTGTYFRIGIANTRPADTIADEARGTQRYLEGSGSPNQRSRLVRTATTTFLGVPAVDQEYVGTNSAGISRRYVLRLWFDAGHTLEIEVNAPSAQFVAARSLFDRLTASCRVT